MQLRRINKRQRASWATPIVAAVTSVAVVAAAAFGGNEILKTQEIASGPIETSLEEASFADGETVVVDDPAIATQGEDEGPRAVKEFHRDQTFSQFALTWTGQRDIAVFVRAKRADGSWSEWYNAAPIATKGNEKTGTELIYIEPTNDVQVSVGNVDLYAGDAADAAPAADAAAAEALPAAANGDVPLVEQAATAVTPLLETNVGDIAPVAEVEDTAGAPTLPSDLDVVFIDGNAQDGIAPVADLTSKAMPQVVSRAGWGANEGIRCSAPTYDDRVKALTLHHTAGSNDYTQAQAAGQVRGIYQYHAQALGWCDIGYNVLVDKFGTIYEGRYGGLDKAVQGAHVGGFNQNTWGISTMGDYDKSRPSEAMLESVAAIAGWKAAVSGFDPSGTTSLTSNYTYSGTKYPAGSTYTGPAFMGHGDLHNNACPGRYNIARWADIRRMTKQKYDAMGGAGAQSGQLNLTTDTPSGSQGSLNPGGGTQPSNPNAMSSLGGVDVPVGSIEAIVGIAAALVVIFGTVSGTKASDRVDMDQEVVPGLSLSEIPSIVSKVVAISGNEGLRSTWTAVLNSFGPVLGLAVGGPNAVNVGGIDSALIYQLFSNGVVLSTQETGTHALVGEIAKKWAENPEALGLPTSDEYSFEGKKIRVDFEGGHLVFDPETQKVDLFRN